MGNELKTTEFNKGYIGAINKPTKGNANPINGISEIELIATTFNPTVFGNTNKTTSIALIMQKVNTQIQFIFLVITPANNLPTANDIARMLAIIILMFSGR